MKQLILLFSLVLSLSSFAGGFTKADVGTIKWSVSNSGAQEIKASFNRSYHDVKMIESENPNVTTAQTANVREAFYAGFKNKGFIGGYYTTFLENHDECSEDKVTKELKRTLNAELNKLRLNFKISSSDVELQNVICEEKGLFSKSLECTAQYKSLMSVQLLD